MARTRLAGALTRTGEQDRDAFRDVYTLTSAKLFGICLRICGERHAAEEVLHEVYLTVWKRAGAWDPGRSSPITWLSIIARNRALDWRRAQGVRRAAPLDDAVMVIDPAAGPESIACACQQSRRLLTFIDALGKRQSDAIRAAFFDGLSYRELAQQTGVPLGTMKSCIRRGLAKLRVDLSAEPDLLADLAEECRHA
ncbi:sigma-70 family RNA polymerase sigma factor [Sphingomonas koreensis]|nr:sigma-70 family RNA polymerase sigma factor [Sphingomonas koreensis]